LSNSLFEIDVDSWTDHQVADKIFEEFGEAFDKSFEDLIKNRSRYNKKYRLIELIIWFVDHERNFHVPSLVHSARYICKLFVRFLYPESWASLTASIDLPFSSSI
jgi:hypothetical protein